MKIKTNLIAFSMMIVFSIYNYAQVQNIAHRGCSSLAPENTYSAWVKAIETGADYFELDIQLSSDDSMMIMHDASVDRTTNGSGSVSSMTYGQLRLLDAGSWFSPEFTGEKIPTFSEALELSKTNGIVDIVAEIKTTDATIVPKVIAMIQAYGMQSRVIVSSFTYSQIAQCRSLDASIDIQLFGTITNAMIDQVALINGEWVGSGGTITQALIDYAHSKNVLFNGWTINTGSQMLALIALGIDGITTNFPQVLVAVTDSTAPADVIINSAITTGETDISLDWESSEDPESGITGYEIYRDLIPNPITLYVTVGDTTNYVDYTLTENETFYYRIKALNGAGLKSTNYSNEVSATTNADITKPVVSFVTSERDTSTVYIEFSERVEEASAEVLTNYNINKGVSVLSAELMLDEKTVFLKTSSLLDSTYTLAVSNVKDKAIVPNVMLNESMSFTHKNITSDIIACYNLDDYTIVGPDTVIYDASLNANNGVVKNGAVISSGYLGNSMEFDGVDDFVQFQNSPSFNFNGGGVTVSVWTKLTYLPSQLLQPFGPLFDAEGDQFVLYEDRGNNELRFKVVTNVTAERPGIPGADLVTGKWIHVVGVYNGSHAKVYLNGVLKDSHILTGNVNTGIVPMLGKSGTSGTPSYFKGSIDNVLVFNYGFTDDEVSGLYNNTKIPANIIVGVESTPEYPKEYSLSQNYPNPFNPSTTIKYDLPVVSKVSIKIFDLLGKEVASLVNEEKEAGYHQVLFDGKGLSSGTYFFRIQADNFVQTKKMILIK